MHSPVNVDLALERGFGGSAQGDFLFNIENVFDSFFGDVLTGRDGVNWLQGWEGADTLDGRPGSDILDGGNGLDFAAYGESPTGVMVDLRFRGGSGGHAHDSGANAECPPDACR